MAPKSPETRSSVAENDTSAHFNVPPCSVENMISPTSPGAELPERVPEQTHPSDTSTSTCRSPLTDGGEIMNEDEMSVLTPLTELSSDPCEDVSEERASVTSDGSSNSSDATSSEISAPRKSPTRPRLFMDCVIPPPFYFPKKLFRPMREVHPEMVSNTGDESNVASPEPEAATSKRGRGKKRKRNRSRSRSHSPLHVYSEEQALELFGQNMTMYSVCGPPGGYLIGLGTLQCCPEDNGQASFKVDIDEARLGRLAEETQQAREELLNCNAGHTSTSKPSKVKRQTAKPKSAPPDKGKTKEVQPTEASSCHICCRKSNMPKMTCSGLSPNGTRCKARFCESCIRRKFPDVRFDAEERDFTCPRCAGYCPCHVCARKREKGDHKNEPATQRYEKKPSVTRQAKKLSIVPKRMAENIPEEEDASVRESIPKDVGGLPSARSTKATSMKKQESRWVNLLLDDTPDATQKSCHQCKNRNRYAKMRYDDVQESGHTCDAHYCHRCVASRYPEFEFTPGATFKCFKCQNTCNCGPCSRNRGEEFVKTSSIKDGNPKGSQVDLPMAQSRSGRRIKPSEKVRRLDGDNDGDSGPRKRRRYATSTSAADDASTISSLTMSKSATDRPPSVIPGSPLSESHPL